MAVLRGQALEGGILPVLDRPRTGICGLYLGTQEDIPANAIVLSIDEKSQIQALDRTVPILPMQPGKVERRSHDYYRHGATTLFVALEIATGQVTAALKPKRRDQEFLAFLKQIPRAYCDAVDEVTGEPVELHLVMDNYAAHKHAAVRHGLATNPRFKVHLHPDPRLLDEPGRGLVRPGAHPFVWTKTAEEILKKANRPTTSNPRH